MRFSERRLALVVVVTVAGIGIVLGGGTLLVNDPAHVGSTGETVGAMPDERATELGQTSAESQRTTTHEIGTGDDQTTVYEIDSGEPGPTVVVVGGAHGDEPAGYETASNVAQWDIDAGTLVVVPELSPAAVDDETRFTDAGTPAEHDFNRQFPVGEEPRTEHARAVWNEIESYDPDVVMDLHSSKGIYNSDVGGGSRVGQVVFPTVTGQAIEHSSAVVAEVNDNHVSDSRPPVYDFEQGEPLDRSGNLLIRKVAGDLGVNGYLIETTKYDVDLETQIEWTETIVSKLLHRHGLLQEER